jgi:hypothetical protein
MEEAYQIDIEENREKRPAIQKLRLLNNVEIFLKRV